MCAMPKRFRPRSGLITPDSVPSEVRREHTDEEAAILVVRLKAVLTLFAWFVSLLLCGLGIVSRHPPQFVGQFVAAAAAIFTGGLLCLMLAGRRQTLIAAIPWICAVAVFLLPQIFSGFTEVKLSMLFDLYVVLFMALPAFLQLWEWRLQTALSLVIVAGTAVQTVQHNDTGTIPALILIATAAILSGLVVITRDDEANEQLSRWRTLASRLLHESSLHRLPQQVWNLMLAETAILIFAVFVDISLGSDEFSAPVLAKLYGIAVAVFCGLLAVLLSPSRIPRVAMLTTTFIGLVFCLSRIEYIHNQSIYFALPLVLIFLVASVLHWSLELQLQLVWTLLLGDLTLKAAAFRAVHPGTGWFAAVGEVLAAHRAENAALAIGAGLSVLVASNIRRLRFSNISQFVSLFDLGGRSSAPAGEGSAVQYRLEDPCAERMLPERNRQLFFGLFCLGIISSAVSSRILQTQGHASGGLVVLSWVVFLLLWAGLVYQDRRAPKWSYLWTFGAALKVLLLLWPTVLLVIAPNAANYWIAWPVLLCVGIGVIPWGLRELIPILLADAAFGVELSYRLMLSAESNSVLIGAGVLSALLSVQNARRIRERSLFVNFHRALDGAHDSAEVLRALGDYLSHLFGGEGVFLAVDDHHCEFLRGPHSYLLRQGSGALHRLRNEFTDLVPDSSGVASRPVNALSGRLDVLDERLGVISPGCGLLVEVTSEVAERQRRGLSPALSDRKVLFVTTALPIYPLFQEQELMLTQMLSAVARLKLSSLAQVSEHDRLSQAIEGQAAQREYELSALVHDINNTVQDLTLLCENIIDRRPTLHGMRMEEIAANAGMVEQVKRIAAVARSVATVVSDAKRRRELERTEDLTPRELVEVNEVLRELVSFATIRAERKRIQIEELTLPEEKIYVMVSVKEHLETILRNILNNAITYSRAGSTIQVQLHTDPNTVKIEVTDNGPGLSEEECESIFLPGVRGRASVGIQGGLGLGLAESRRVARAAGGDITAQSPGTGLGSTFTISLPRHARASSHVPAQHWALLVDDQPALTDFYSRIARAMNLHPETASSVEDAWSIVEERGRPGLVLTDIHLGESNGLDLVEKLRGKFGPQLPIVVISGLNSEDVLRRVRTVGATDFVAKPVGRSALFARIQSLISTEGR